MSDSVGRTDDLEGDDPDVVTSLREAAQAREDARDAVEDVGRDRLVALRDALDSALRLFDRYEESASGTGDFESYLSFQDDLVAFVEDLPEDLPEREVFEGWLDDFKKRRLSTNDFDRGRRELAPVEDLVDRLDDLEAATETHRQAVSSAKGRRDTLEDHIQHLERVRELGDADLDAPVEDIRDPIETYNEQIREDFETFLRASPSRDVLAFFERAQSFPLVDVDAPPSDIRHYVADDDVGSESVARLLELADFSQSKLQHFVEDPASFKRVVGGNRTYLDSLSADPLTVAWPPEMGSVLQRRVDELISLVGPFADEDAVARLREIQQRARDDDFQRLRDAAVAAAELSDEDRDRLRTGQVERELEAAQAELDAVEDALEEYA